MKVCPGAARSRLGPPRPPRLETQGPNGGNGHRPRGKPYHRGLLLLLLLCCCPCFAAREASAQCVPPAAGCRRPRIPEASRRRRLSRKQNGRSFAGRSKPTDKGTALAQRQRRLNEGTKGILICQMALIYRDLNSTQSYQEFCM